MRSKIFKLVLAAAVGILAGVLFFNNMVMAANTVSRSGNVITISSIDSDWLWSDTFPLLAKVPVIAIFFKGAAADDACVIKEGSASGPAFFDVKVNDSYDQRQGLYGGAKLRPVLDYSAGTYTAGSTVTIILGLE